MVISKRNKILLLLLFVIIAFYYCAKYYDKIETEREYEAAKIECRNSMVEGLNIEFKHFNRKELKNLFLLKITDSLGHIYFNKKEMFRISDMDGLGNYGTFRPRNTF